MKNVSSHIFIQILSSLVNFSSDTTVSKNAAILFGLIIKTRRDSFNAPYKIEYFRLYKLSGELIK